MTRVVDQIDPMRQTVKWIDEKSKAELVLVDDSFQRNFVWQERHKIRLIDSILLGFPIPAIYLWEQETDPATGEAKYLIVDGQQRINSIIQFIDGAFPLKKNAFQSTKKAEITEARAQYAGKYFSELPSAFKSALWSYYIPIAKFRPTVTRDMIVATFLRLNSTNFTLNPQELRNAEFDGQLITLCEEVLTLKFWRAHQIFTEDEIRRMADIQFVSTILMFFRFGITEETSQKNINKLYDTFNEVYRERAADKRLFVGLLRSCDSLIDDSEDVRKFIRVKSHLYSLILCAYKFHREKILFKDVHRARLRRFIAVYNSNKRRISAEERSVKKYRLLTTEGTQKRANRIQRFEILANWLMGTPS